MKKLVYILSCLFLLSAGFAACSCESDDPPEQPSSHQNEEPVDSTDNNSETPSNNPTVVYLDTELLKSMSPEEMVKRGFRLMGLQGSWTMETFSLRTSQHIDEGITFTFDEEGTLKVENLLGTDYLLPAGNYSYVDNLDDETRLTIDGTKYVSYVRGNTLYIGTIGGYIEDKDYNALCYLHRQRTAQNEIPYFFAEELNDPVWDSHGERIGGGFIDSMTVHFRDKEAFYVVNSKQELERIYNGKTPIPDIDFSSYTLLLGFVYLNDSSYHLSDIGLRDSGNQYALDVSVLHYVHQGAFFGITKGYYWRLYPKLDKEVVANKIIHVIE